MLKEECTAPHTYKGEAVFCLFVKVLAVLLSLFRLGELVVLALSKHSLHRLVYKHSALLTKHEDLTKSKKSGARHNNLYTFD